MRETSTTPSTIDEVTEHFIAAFKPHHQRPSNWPARDITIGQLKTLFMLRHEGPQSVGHIAEHFGIGAAAASGYVERIERHGLIQRRHRHDDRRVVECHITHAGERLLDFLAGSRTVSLKRALAFLSPLELAEFDRLLLLIAERSHQEAMHA